jgi:hypothetical protein
VIVMALQGTPPTPPTPPGQEVTVSGSLEGWDAVVLLGVLLLTAAVLLWPLIRAVARRIERGGAADALGELEELRERVRQLEEAQPRLSDLEERLDYTERVLAQAQQQARLGTPMEGGGR